MDEYMIDISAEYGLTPGKLYLLQIAKTSIDRMSLDFMDKCLVHLHDQGSKAFGTVITMIDGYGDIADDIYTIPEIRTWMTALIRKYPYILYFINYSFDSHINLLSCIGDIAMVYVGEPNLTPEEYIRRGINPLSDVTPREWVITLNDETYALMEASLIEYGNKVDDFLGASETIKMIQTIANRNIKKQR